jgi:ribonuclease-3
MSDPLEDLETRLGVRFADRGLLQLALTHPSWTEAHGGENYQRLEFLGDSVLGFVVAEMVYTRFPDSAEGDLTQRKRDLVCGATLAAVARELGLGEHIRTRKEATQDRERDSVLEAALEAVVAAVFLDMGLTPTRALLVRMLGDRLESVSLDPAAPRNPKGDLQELAHARNLEAPAYALISTDGPVHDPQFVVAVSLGQREVGQGTGSSKQSAEQDAAREALGKLSRKRSRKR